jgi:hypothetical protein
LAESHLTRWLFGARVRRIVGLPPPAGYTVRVEESIQSHSQQLRDSR